jgi:hypothetical protein
MGKKSKKGVSRAGAKAHPRSGGAKRRVSGRSESGSMASSDMMSVDSSDNLVPTMPSGKSRSVPPANLSIVMPSATAAAVSDEEKPFDESQDVSDEMVGRIAMQAAEKALKEVVPIPEEPDPVVKEVKSVVKKAAPAKVAAEAEAPVTHKSRGLDLNEPAPEEAAVKQKDCECVIL